MENTALILIDIQNDYFSNGALALKGANDAATNANRLLNIFREKQLPIAHIKHETTKPEMRFMLPGTFGQNIHDSVKPLKNETCFTKHYPNSFWQTGIEKHLKDNNIEHLVIVGMMTHMSISTTVRAAMERGFKTTIIRDACATRSLEFNGEVIPEETVQKIALAELTIISQLTSLNSFITKSFNIKP